MGCVVSQNRVGVVNVIQTPRPKAFQNQTEDTKSKQKEKENHNSSYENIDGKESSLNERQYREQVFIMRMESIGSKKRKNSGEHKFVLQRTSSIVGLKEASFNEFSFKNSVDSSRDKDKENSSNPSSRQNVDNLPNVSNDTNRRRSVDMNNILGGYGFKRASTPSFMNRPSGFFLERNNSRRSLTSKPVIISTFYRPPPFSSGTLMPHDLRSKRASSELNSPLYHPSIEDDKLPEAELRACDSRVMPLHPLDAAKDFAGEEQKLDEPNIATNPVLNQQLTKADFLFEGLSPQAKKTSSLIAGFELFKEQSAEKELGSTKTRKEECALTTIQDGNSFRNQSSIGVTRFLSQAKSPKYEGMSSFSNQVTILEPLTFMISENFKFNTSPKNGMMSSDIQSKSQGGTTPVRGLTLEKVAFDNSPLTQETGAGSPKPSYGRLPSGEPASAKRSGRSHSASKLNFIPHDEKIKNLQPQNPSSATQSTLKNCFSSSGKLSVKEKFKRNLLEVVSQDEDDILPILSVQKRNTKTSKPIFRQDPGNNENLGFDEPNTKKHVFEEVLKKSKSEPPKETTPVTRDNFVSSKEMPVQIPEVFKSSSEPVKQIPKRNTALRKKNLLTLAREANDKDDVQVNPPPQQLIKMHSVENTHYFPVKNPFNRLEMANPDNTRITGLSQSPIGRINISTRNNNLDFDTIQTSLSNTPVAYNINLNRMGSQQNSNSQSVISPIHSPLNETNNRSFINVEDNFSVENITNYVFLYDEIEQEDKANNRSRVYNNEQILSGIGSPMKSQSYSPLNNPQRNKISEDQRDLFLRERNNLLTLSPIQRKDSPYNGIGANLFYTWKESFTSLSTICGGQNPDLTDFNQSMFTTDKPGFSRQTSEVQGEDKEMSGSSPDHKKFMGMSTDTNRFKPFRTSKFQQGYEGNTEVTNSEQNSETKQEDPGRLNAPATRSNTKFLQRSKSSGLGAQPEIIQEFVPSERNEASPFGKISGQGIAQPSSRDHNHLLVPSADNVPSNNRRKTLMRLPSAANQPGPKSPLLKGAVLKRTLTSVIETDKLDKTRDEEGQKKINQYLLIKDLGRGGFGKVKLAQDTLSHRYFAVKIANKAKLKRKLISKTKDALITLESEIAIMKKLNHDNIVKLWEVIDDPKEEKLYLVMDLVKKGAVMSKPYWRYENKQALDRSAFSAMDNSDTSIISEVPLGKRVLTEEKALKYFRGLVLGLDYLHNHVGVIHRDIKPENLLIDEFDYLKISDFGVSSIMEDNSDELKNNAGTKLFLPPESFEGKSYKGKPADIWAVGATLYYFMTGKPPFNTLDQVDLRNKVMKEEPEYPEHINTKILEVIQGCLKKDPEKRMTIAEIMASPWLTEDGTYTVKNVFEDDDGFKTSEQDVHSALTSLRIRVAVKLKMKRRLDKTRSKIEQRKSGIIDSSVLPSEQQKLNQLPPLGKEANTEAEEIKNKEALEKKEQAAQNSFKNHRLNLFKAI